MKKFGDLIMILDLHRQGLKISMIARQLGIDRKTVRKYLARDVGIPTYGPRQPRKRLIDTSISGRRVVHELGDLIAGRGAPKMTPAPVRDQRQWDGADVERGAGLVRRCRDRVALYRIWQTNAERVRREL